VKLSIGLPAGFRFRSAVLSHGWAALPPFRFDPAAETLSVNLALPGRRSATVEMSQEGRSLVIEARSRAAFRDGDGEVVRIVVRSVLRIDQDLGPFYREAARHPEFGWVRGLGAGRLLRAPSAFEDAVKMICTTNCSWALTTNMVRNLCDTLGRGPAGAKAFPLPRDMAGKPESFYRTAIRSGYRSPFLVRLARRVDSGELDIERWRDPEYPAEKVREEMRSVEGIGPYAAGNLMKLVGKYDELGIDSWCRKQFSALHRGGRPATDRAIERHYSRYGEWKGLFFWLDLTKEWYSKSYGEIFG
jgi:3-methyladenine DNA glycosylase/8-oxoguanine DNA glycosylase